MALEAKNALPQTQRPRLQFSLLALLVSVTLVGGVLGLWFYNRPLTTTVSARFAVIDASAAKTLMVEHPPQAVDGSIYAWMILSGDELDSALLWQGKPAPTLEAGAAHTVPYWPRTAFSGTYIRSVLVPLGPNFSEYVFESGELSGFVGSRRSGLARQFRVECDMSCQHPLVKQMTVDNSDARATIKGKLFYEGAIPEGHLIFLAPLDDDGFSVVIFDVK